MADTDEFILIQSPNALQDAAALADMTTQNTGQVPLMSGVKPRTVFSTPKTGTSSGPWLSFFFDGTGNNKKADEGTKEHSNVVRLYLSHPEDAAPGNTSVYIPGVGTPFDAVKDKGTSSGLAFAAMGEQRLIWAMEQFEAYVDKSKDPINIALFGFSRGAALARAMASKIAKRAEQRGQKWFLESTSRPISIAFLGLFDTVASVGLAVSVNNSGWLGLKNPKLAMQRRHWKVFPNALQNISAGPQPGADPASGPFNGHATWGRHIQIPSMVKQCVHLVAAHEIRNSFPLDSILENRGYLPNCVEEVFPGAHSDVGGGYREGEGARGMSPGEMLSLIALRRMWLAARDAGVPLLPYESPTLAKEFVSDVDSAGAYSVMTCCFDAYMKAIKDSDGAPLGLGKQILSHMKMYYRWRFYKIALNQIAHAAHQLTPDEKRLNFLEETKWAKEREEKETGFKDLKQKARHARREVSRYKASMDDVYATKSQAGDPSLEVLMRISEEKTSAYLMAKAVFTTMPSSADSLVKHLSIYDSQLMSDAITLQGLAQKKKLRPHYKALLEAYEDEFLNGKGLKNEDVISFFDNYVHDSLAGFAMDATLPSDPRIIYLDKNNKLPYAVTEPIRKSIADLA